jgi:hypothetical protein
MLLQKNELRIGNILITVEKEHDGKVFTIKPGKDIDKTDILTRRVTN